MFIGVSVRQFWETESEDLRPRRDNFSPNHQNSLTLHPF